MQRQDVPDHLHKNCPLRDYHCPHCQLRGTYKNITTSHFTICEDFPLNCPAGCHSDMPRKKIATHLQQTCPMEFVECEYKMLGCSELVRRKAIEEHFADDKYHMKMAMKAQVAMFSCMQSAISTSFKSRPDVSLLPLTFRAWLQNMPTCYPRPPWVVKMEGFQEKTKSGEGWLSDPVYSHFGGYKICLSVEVNGACGVRGTDMSLYACLMRGDNDSNLKWPFKGTIKVSLLNQLEDGQHHTREPWSPDNDVPKTSCGRVTGKDKAGGWGHPHFIPHQDLGYQDNKNQQFLKDDALFFRVDCIEPKLDGHS